MKVKFKTRLEEPFKIHKWTAEKKWTAGISFVFFVFGIVMLIVTSWYSIDKKMTDFLGGGCLKLEQVD